MEGNILFWGIGILLLLVNFLYITRKKRYTIKAANSTTEEENLKKELLRLNNELKIRINNEMISRYSTEERYKDLFENINEAILVFEHSDEGYITTEANFNALKLFNKEKNEIIGLNIRDLFDIQYPEDLLFERMEKSGIFQDKLTLEIDQKELTLILKSRAYIFRGSKNIILTISDITDKEQLKKEQKEQKHLFETLFKKANTGICILDVNGAFIKCNKRFLNMVGIQKEDIRDLTICSLMSEESREIFRKENKNIFSNFAEIQNEYVLINRDNEQVYVIGSSVLLQNSKNNFRLLTLEDITKLKNLEEQQKTQERLMAQQAKMAEMGDMVGAIAHQWRQPLNSINAAAIKIRFLNELGTLNDKEVVDTTIFIEEQSSKMSQTINDFLNFFKPSKEKERFLLKTVIENIKNMISTQLESRNIEIILNMDEKLEIFGYKNELEHALLNIITNARDAHEGKNIQHKKIIVNTMSDGEIAKIDVLDNAGGIPDGIINKIFNPYFSTKPPDKGTGIGLYMVKNILERGFGGSIKVCNIEDGAKFEIIIQRG